MNKITFMGGMVLGLAVGGAVGALSQSRKAKMMGKKFMHSPAGKLLKDISGIIEEW